MNKIHCKAPWVSVSYMPAGKFAPCCRWKDHYFDSQQEMVDKVGGAFLAGQVPKGCEDECPSNSDIGWRNQFKNYDTDYKNNVIHFLDFRNNNVCNLKCRSCGPGFSTSWAAESKQLVRHEDSIRLDEIDLSQCKMVYFAGGEPLLMEEHYRILDELVRRGRFEVTLIYNTNFTHTNLKGQSVFEYWKLFKNVAVGASLDGSGKHAEYIRKGTDWKQIEQNRIEMLQVCPQVDFYISPTLSIMNAWQLPDFHRDWVERGFIKPQDLNVNILQDPPHLRIDIAPVKYKQRLRVKYQEHLEWLHEQDPLQRASVGFESAINFMMATDNTHLIDTFWRKTHELDSIRSERLLDVIPELQSLL